MDDGSDPLTLLKNIFDNPDSIPAIVKAAEIAHKNIPSDKKPIINNDLTELILVHDFALAQKLIDLKPDRLRQIFEVDYVKYNAGGSNGQEIKLSLKSFICLALEAKKIYFSDFLILLLKKISIT